VKEKNMADELIISLPQGIKLDTVSFRTDHYIDEIVPKNSIVLHQTEGWSAQTSFDWLMQTYQTVMVAFFVDRDGTVFQTFPCDRWAWHLGRGVPTILNKDSIAIEIANLGMLVRRSDDLYDDLAKKRICSLFEKEKYYQTFPDYRSVAYFERNPEAQINAIRALITELCARFCIPKLFCPDPWVYDPKFASKKFRGIYHHAKVRIDKVDLHPEFPIGELLN
jgi:hypothetical protein